MIRLPNRPYLGLLALLRAGVVFFSIGLIGVAIVAYAPQHDVVGWFLISLGGAVGFLVFCGVVVGGIVHEHERIDDQEKRNAKKLDQEIERRQLDIEVTRAALDSTPAADDVAPEQDDEKAEAVRRWLRAGDRLGFGINAMCPSVVRRQDWPWFQSFYVSDAGWGLLQWIGGQAATEWAEGWNLATAMSELDAGRLPLPPGKPPTVHILVVNTAQEMRKHNVSGQGRGASEVVIDQ